MNLIMSLSVLPMRNGPDGYGLWDSVSKSWLLTGPQEKLFDHKNAIESAMQKSANEDHRQRLRTEYLDMLTAPGSGYTPTQAEQFLKSKMPYLFQ